MGFCLGFRAEILKALSPEPEGVEGGDTLEKMNSDSSTDEQLCEL